MTLGRIEIVEGMLVIPPELLAKLGVRPGDELEIKLQGEEIVLRKAPTLVH